MNNTDIKYFLAANSSEGFVSHFSGCYDVNDGWKAYIIKGGPGTGKSSFMKHIAYKAIENNENITLCPCTSDPDSLDGIILNDRKTVFLDGTSPHTLDPAYPGICEEILNFGEFWNGDILFQNKEEIINITNENKSLHRTASGNIKAAGELIKDSYKISAACSDKEKIKKYALKLCKKHIIEDSDKFNEQIRFLTATTPKGVISFANTTLATAQNKIIIEDSCGFVSTEIFRIIRNCCIDKKLSFITVLNPFLPSLMIDGIIIPNISLAFIREYEYSHITSDTRRVHSRRFTKAKQLSKNRKRLRFNKNTANKLLLNAVNTLSNAKSVHDDLELCYRKAMDFEALTKFATEFEKKIF